MTGSRSLRDGSGARAKRLSVFAVRGSSAGTAPLPVTLLKEGRAEVTSYGGELIGGTSTDPRAASAAGGAGVGEDGRRFEVTLSDGRSLQACRVLVTTGLRDELPDIPGVRDAAGRDLPHCPYCHGYEVRDQPVGVLGGTPEAVTTKAGSSSTSWAVPAWAVRATGNAAKARAQVVTAAGDG